MKSRIKTLALLSVIGILFAYSVRGVITIIDKPDTSVTNDFYIGNHAPLKASAFLKLPIGTIRPRGWMHTQLVLQAEGFVGHLAEISGWLNKNNNAWLSPTGAGNNGWEEVPYWLKGFADTGYLLGDTRITNEAMVWINGILGSLRTNGYFGPESNLTREGGKPDLWPNMIALFCLQSYYEYSGDERVINVMSNYFDWELSVPDSEFLHTYWQNMRGGDNLFSVYWLYNRTGQTWLLTLAQKIHNNTANWAGGVPNWHGVNIAQGFREPATWYLQSGNISHLNATENDYQTVYGLYGQVPGGMFGADENCREGYIDPRQGAESCTMVEMMLSHELLLRFSGDTKWADRCEEIMFNSYPASQTADKKALRYLTCPNQATSDGRNKSPSLQNGGVMQRMDPWDYRCCQHNVSHGLPYYIEHLWLATPDNGLAAALYAPCKVTVRIGNGATVTVVETTHYPFNENIDFDITLATPTEFPLFLRVPQWCTSPELFINGSQESIPATSASYIRIEREWETNATVRLVLPMNISIKHWPENHNCVSVNRGPLTYSLAFDESYIRNGGTTSWPAWDIAPSNGWNYGLVLNEADPTSSFSVVMNTWPDNDNPFDTNSPPIMLKATGRKINQWVIDSRGVVQELQQSPALSHESDEIITLIPMGTTRLRISAFPVIGSGTNVHEWKVNASPSASHCFWTDTVDALNDGKEPANSNDQSIPRMTWWDHKGSVEWVQYTYGEPQLFINTEVYWFDDRSSGGGCRVPESWEFLYSNSTSWVAVNISNSYGTQMDQYNMVNFNSISSAAVRVQVQLQSGYSGGILEWKVGLIPEPGMICGMLICFLFYFSHREL